MLANNTPTNEKKPLMVAVEDALVVGVYTFVGGLIATGATFPPAAGVCYATGLVAALAGTISWAKARNVQVKL